MTTERVRYKEREKKSVQNDLIPSLSSHSGDHCSSSHVLTRGQEATRKKFWPKHPDLSAELSWPGERGRRSAVGWAFPLVGRRSRTDLSRERIPCNVDEDKKKKKKNIKSKIIRHTTKTES